MESPDAHRASPDSTTDLVKRTLAEARELVQLEVQIAKQELREDLIQTEKAAIAGAVALVLLLLALAALVVAVIVALGGTVLAAALVGAGFIVLAAGAVALAYALAPKSPLGRTRRRLKEDVNRLKEHAA